MVKEKEETVNEKEVDINKKEIEKNTIKINNNNSIQQSFSGFSGLINVYLKKNIDNRKKEEKSESKKSILPSNSENNKKSLEKQESGKLSKEDEFNNLLNKVKEEFTFDYYYLFKFDMEEEDIKGTKEDTLNQLKIFNYSFNENKEKIKTFIKDELLYFYVLIGLGDKEIEIYKKYINEKDPYFIEKYKELFEHRNYDTLKEAIEKKIRQMFENKEKTVETKEDYSKIENKEYVETKKEESDKNEIEDDDSCICPEGNYFYETFKLKKEEQIKKSINTENNKEEDNNKNKARRYNTILLCDNQVEDNNTNKEKNNENCKKDNERANKGYKKYKSITQTNIKPEIINFTTMALKAQEKCSKK